MNKKTIKPIILSALSALAFGAVGTAGTFALFTDKAETTVSVEAGVVDIDTELSDLKFYELNNAEEITATNAAGAKINSIGGTAKIDGSTLTLQKWAPGDKVTFKITVKNKSNVKTQTRLRVTHTSSTNVDLYDALAMDCVASGSIDSADLFHWSSLNESNDTQNGQTVSVISVTIEFPNIGNEITAREEGINNHYQGAGCTIKFTQQAVQGNANVNDIVSQLNAIVSSPTSTQVNKSLTAAIAETDTTSALLQSENIVWNVKEDKFYYEEEALGNRNDFFKVQDSLDDVQRYSVYASESWNDANVTVKGIGFDVGDAALISNINYYGVGEARENSIYTNSINTNLTIDAELDTVHHSGNLNLLTIIAVAGTSYHEYGKAAFVKLAKGRLALEENSEVQRIHVEKKADAEAFNDIIIAKDEKVELPELSRDPVQIAEEGTLVLALQSSTAEVTEQTPLDYVWLTKQGVFEQVAISDNDLTAAPAATPTEIKYADDNDTSETTQSAAQQIANNISENVVIGETAYTVTVDPTTRDLVVKDSDSNPVVVEQTVTAAVAEALNEKGLNEQQKEAAIAETHTIAEMEENSENSDFVARIGATGYMSLFEATQAIAASETKTIKLLKDVSLTGNSYYYNNKYYNYDYNFNGTVTIDLGGHTISKIGRHYFNIYKSLTLKNGTYYSEQTFFHVKTKDTTLHTINVNFIGYRLPGNGIDGLYSVQGFSAIFDKCTFRFVTGSDSNARFFAYMAGTSSIISLTFNGCDFNWRDNLVKTALNTNNVVRFSSDCTTSGGESKLIVASNANHTIHRETVGQYTVCTPVARIVVASGCLSAKPDGYQTDGNGNATISSAQGLVWFSQQVNEGNNFEGKTVTLAADLDMQDYAWKPIGLAWGKSFNGTFDGGNHTIRNLVSPNGFIYPVNNKQYGDGLFHRITNATIQNLVMDSAELAAATTVNIVGTVTGYSAGTCHYNNVIVKNSVLISNGKMGGLIGMGEGSDSRTYIDHCAVIDTSLDGFHNLAGFVGTMQGEIYINDSYTKNVTFKAPFSLDDHEVEVNAMAMNTVTEEPVLAQGTYYWIADYPNNLYMHHSDFYCGYKADVYDIVIDNVTYHLDGIDFGNADSIDENGVKHSATII